MFRFGSAVIGLLVVLGVVIALVLPRSVIAQGMMGNGSMGYGMMGQGMMGYGAAGPGSMGQGMGGYGPTSQGAGSGGHGNMPRHHFAMMSGVPAPYSSLHNPLPHSPATIAHGATVYIQSCASCHGPSGAGNGEAARSLSAPPANLAWLAQMPMARWDSYMYWAIAEGGAQFGSAMPAFKGALSKDNIWSVIAYIQAGFPRR